MTRAADVDTTPPEPQEGEHLRWVILVPSTTYVDTLELLNGQSFRNTYRTKEAAKFMISAFRRHGVARVIGEARAKRLVVRQVMCWHHGDPKAALYLVSPKKKKGRL